MIEEQGDFISADVLVHKSAKGCLIYGTPKAYFVTSTLNFFEWKFTNVNAKETGNWLIFVS